MDPTDSDLVRATLRGDSRAFEALLGRHGRVVWASVRRLCADPEEARELYQDAVVKAYENLGELREVERLRSWWLSIAMNLSRERLRRGGRRARLEGDGELLDQVADGAEPTEAALERREEAGRLRAALEQLPERQREVCDLRLAQGLSHAEIGAVLGITTEASRANYYQAVRRLRERLSDA
ncbi:RNA polymerase sigma factor [Engelhardtia mirabilis]|uniref:ECF RNA polymerase sigma factor SigW n=1 Tax=Engelhardtia mirabilis TaxID=2528011 RepID=A0A518BIX0_9BACT|nr:ECF RNA polymerase sigma factor SigW [Planctomycetes bacterium Pla133]QDV01256.1 ECF RNA polymerase sigma factor SigW [Planctomycetes bacterium Pla86]